jgi:chemotaxis protein CheC
MIDLKNLTPFQLDALREIGNIGASHADTALSEMLHKKVWISVPEAKVVPLDEVPQEFGGAEKMVVGVYLQMQGQISGNILFFFSQETAMTLADILMNRPAGSTKVLNEMDQSAIKETGTILAGSCLTALSALTNKEIIPSIPYYAMDMLGALVDFIIINLSQNAEYAMIIQLEFSESEYKIDGSFLLLPDPQSLEVILTSLGVG